jgi:ankyrin repeat protein
MGEGAAVSIEQAYHEDIEYYEGRAEGLLASARDGTEGAVAAFEGHPLTTEAARSVVARRHGLADWDALKAHVAGLRDSGEPFFRAYRAIEDRDTDALRDLLDEHPDLAHAQGTNGNDLLGMAGSTGEEQNVRLLLDRGADAARGNAHGWTPLHQAAYSDDVSLARLMLDAGTPVDAEARGSGGTALIVGLFWGHRGVPELLAQRSLAPGNLRVAAGLGRVDLLDPGTERAAARRGFYRPHSGFPDWTPADERQEVLDEALAWAARSDRVEAIGTLVGHGADVAADVYRGTPLAWAAACGRVAAIERLVALGADPSGRSTFGGLTHGQDITPLHIAAQSGHEAAVRALLRAGADPSLRDGLYDSTPAGWAQHGGHPDVAALLS